jgi:diguanylate cyclase (GGDEF)-like protein
MAITNYVATFTDISARKNAEQQINTLAFYDSLTQLPNRRLLLDRLAQAQATAARHHRISALLYVDLDNFKTLNDTLGFIKGDLMLQAVAQRLRNCVYESDTVARLGGDEFVVMLEGLGGQSSEAGKLAEAVAEKVRQALGQSYPIGPLEYRSTSSIGIALFGGQAPDALDEPLKNAELAMFQAKSAGRNAICFFDPQMQAEVTARAALEDDLRAALQQHQLVLYYQAQVVSGGRLTGAEALVRWQHPQRGLISPAAFIPLAEETGLILPLGKWVLDTACAQLAAWATLPGMAHLVLAVNVSARQFHQPDFVAQVKATLAGTGANPKRLKLELTESLLVSNVEDVIEKMATIKALGVSFSLDDFGTGYSSLAYLKRMPLDQLKIDQGFVRNILTDPNDAAIAKMVVVLAESMGLSVIAEGVELEAQKDSLAHLGCHAYQGYFFSRPIPLADFEALAQRGNVSQ